jgi:hypothetical protein
MKYIVIEIILFSLLFGCKHKNDLGKLYSLEIIQNNTLEQFSYGELRLAEMKEMIEDRTNPKDFQSSIDLLFKDFLRIDSLTGIHISKISKMKIEMFNSLGEDVSVKNEKSIIHYDYKLEKLSRPISYNLTKVKYTGESNLLKDENRDILIESIRLFRVEICKIIEESLNFEKNRDAFVFIDPQINEFKDDEDFYKQFEIKIKKSKIAPDDFETIKRIYRILSKTDDQWKMIINEKDSWIDDLSILLSIESDILKVRAMAFDQMRSRIGCGGNYNFSHILPIVYGPNAAIAGDTVELKILMAAYNAYQTPTFEIFGGGKLEKVEKGIGYVKVVLPKSKEIEIKGNITVKNKSGIPKTQMWNHKIVILPENNFN